MTGPHPQVSQPRNSQRRTGGATPQDAGPIPSTSVAAGPKGASSSAESCTPAQPLRECGNHPHSVTHPVTDTGREVPTPSPRLPADQSRSASPVAERALPDVTLPPVASEDWPGGVEQSAPRSLSDIWAGLFAAGVSINTAAWLMGAKYRTAARKRQRLGYSARGAWQACADRGMTTIEAALALGKGREAACAAARRYGIQFRSYTPRPGRKSVAEHLTAEQADDYRLFTKTKGLSRAEALRVIGRPDLVDA